VHILIDLNGYTKHARTDIFALKPSPVQMHYLGFPGTMGAKFYDYIVADPTVIPEAFRMYYREKVMYMPHSYLVNDHKQAYPGVFDKEKRLTRAKYGLSEDTFVFCNFNQLYKISPEIFDVWMRILKRVPNAVLWLLRWPGLAEANLLQEAKKRGVREDQLHFTDVVPKQEHIYRGYLADLSLDTPVCNSATTACDILWAGTPLITLPGDRMASRIASSLLSAAGMDELICSSYAEYEELAVTLALDVDKLYQLRRRLEGSRSNSAAFDTARYVKNLEKGFETVWSLFERGLPPDHVHVEDGEPVAVDAGDDVFDGPADGIADGIADGMLTVATDEEVNPALAPKAGAEAGAGAGVDKSKSKSRDDPQEMSGSYDDAIFEEEM
jgi:protein O-GlcNAc transferase